MGRRWQRFKEKVFDMLVGMGGLAVRMDTTPPTSIANTRSYRPTQKGSQVNGTTIAPHPQIVADMMIGKGLERPLDWHTHSVGVDGPVIFRELDSVRVVGKESDGELVLHLTEVLTNYRYAQYRIMYQLRPIGTGGDTYAITLLIFHND